MWKWVGKSRLIMRSPVVAATVVLGQTDGRLVLCCVGVVSCCSAPRADCHIATVNKEDADTRAVTPILVLCNAVAITQQRAPAQYAASRPALQQSQRQLQLQPSRLSPSRIAQQSDTAATTQHWQQHRCVIVRGEIQLVNSDADYPFAKLCHTEKALLGPQYPL